MKRKHISWKTKCAAAVLDAQIVRERFGLHPGRWYEEAKRLTTDQFLSLFQFDHNILHETGDPNVDKYWNLRPTLIQEHRQKTKGDLAIIAKGKRIRKKHLRHVAQRSASHGNVALRSVSHRLASSRNATIKSRGFNKKLTRKFSGKVVPREPR